MTKKWIKLRHKIITGLVRPFFSMHMRAKYGYSYKKYKLPKGKPHLILSNHQTKADQFLIGLIFDKNLYFIARDDLFSMGFLSKALKFMVAPIPKNKVAKDIRTVRDSVRVAKEGGSIALCPEGNLTFSGTTEHIDVSTAKYVKLLGLPVLFVNLRGGYGVRPRWAVNLRKGKMTGAVTRLMEPSEYADMTAEELHEVICRELYVDDRALKQNFYSKANAEGMESCLYVCPHCGITRFVSKENMIKCSSCGLTAVYGTDLTFTEGPFQSVKEWYDYQKDFVSGFDLNSAGAVRLLFSDRIKYVKDEIKNKRKHKVSKKTVVTMFSDRLEITDDFGAKTVPLSEISAMAILGRNKLEISQGSQNYFLIAGSSFNALKYVQFFYHYKNTLKGVQGKGEFLGL